MSKRKQYFIIMGYVYLICDSGHDNMFKIGVTKQTLEKRLKQLQTGNGSEIFLVSYHETDYPYYIEKMLHQRFCVDRKVGEWFDLDNDKVLSFKNECDNLEKIIVELKDNPFFIKNLK